MKLFVALLLAFIYFSTCEKLIDPKFVAHLKKVATWEVAEPHENVFRNMKKEDFKRMLMDNIPAEVGALRNSTSRISRKTDYEDQVAHGNSVPRQFSWYREMPECIHSGRDQGSDCGSCWAFAIANHLSDRFCIWGRDVILSVQHLLECDKRNKCCAGGNDINAYQFLMETGLVEEHCRPYDMQCDRCRPTRCRRHKCKKNSVWFSSNVAKAKKEIYNNGPIQAMFDVYSDFSHYKSGVYYHTGGDYLGIHTVEILGWGVERGREYWLCKNCWGDNWGDNGFFKIRIGECGINRYMSSCIPDV